MQFHNGFLNWMQTVYEDVQEMFTYFKKVNFVDIEHAYHKTVRKAHARLEIQECWTFTPYDWKQHFRTLNK